MAERSLARTQRYDTGDDRLAAHGHRLERVATPTGRSSCWRITLGHPDGAHEPFEFAAAPSHESAAVPSVLRELFAGVTVGRALVPRDHDPVVAGGGVDPLPADASIGRLARFVACRAVHTLTVLDPHLRLDAVEHDVHLARVAARRLRSEVEVMHDVLRPKRASRLASELARLGTLFGDVRDLDVLMLSLERAADPAAPGTRELRIRMRNERRVAALVLRNALCSPRHLTLLEELAAFAATGWSADGSRPGRRARRTTIEMLEHADRRLDRRVAALSDPPLEAELHDERKAAKRLRYEAELAEPMAESRSLGRAARSLQDVLGGLQDAVSAHEWIDRPHRPPLDAHERLAAIAIADAADAARRRALDTWPVAWVRTHGAALRPWRPPT
ncbi:MAG: CHAD domain-containing protein [Ilumatobacteraceae bacterium]